jgi:hypothetical protein
VLRFEDLQLFADDQLDQSIEIARAQQEVALRWTTRCRRWTP